MCLCFFVRRFNGVFISFVVFCAVTAAPLNEMSTVWRSRNITTVFIITQKAALIHLRTCTGQRYGNKSLKLHGLICLKL